MEWNPFDKSIKHSPYFHYSEMASRSPVFESMGLVFVLDYYNVKKVLNNSELFTSSFPVFSPRFELKAYKKLIQHFLFYLETTEGHKLLRKIVGDSFIFAKIESRIEELINARVIQLGKQIEFDVVKEFIEPISYKILNELLGFREEEEYLIGKWVDVISTVDILYGSDKLIYLEELSVEIAGKIKQLISQKKYHFDKGFISSFIHKIGSNSINNNLDKLTSLIAMLIASGAETINSAFGNGIYTLLKNRKYWDDLLSNNHLIPQAVEELIRFETPVQFTMRKVRKNTELNGVVIKEGKRIVLGIGAANRDSGYFRNPNALDFNRKPNAHLGFGGGIHYCFGAKLARLQLKMGLNALLLNFPDMKLSAPEVIPNYKPYNAIKGFSSLKVTIQ